MADCGTCPHHSGLEAELKNILTLLTEKEIHVGAEIKKLCQLFEERQKQSDFRFGSNKEAIQVAKEEMERRLEGMNEFRAQLSSQAATFVSRVELRLEVEKLIGRILVLERETNYRVGSRHWSDYIITSVAAFGIFILAHYILKY